MKDTETVRAIFWTRPSLRDLRHRLGKVHDRTDVAVLLMVRRGRLVGDTPLTSRRASESQLADSPPTDGLDDHQLRASTRKATKRFARHPNLRGYPPASPPASRSQSPKIGPETGGFFKPMPRRCGGFSVPRVRKDDLPDACQEGSWSPTAAARIPGRSLLAYLANGISLRVSEDLAGVKLMVPLGDEERSASAHSKSRTGAARYDELLCWRSNSISEAQREVVCCTRSKSCP